jgi:hypothetical protein
MQTYSERKHRDGSSSVELLLNLPIVAQFATAHALHRCRLASEQRTLPCQWLEVARAFVRRAFSWGLSMSTVAISRRCRPNRRLVPELPRTNIAQSRQRPSWRGGRPVQPEIRASPANSFWKLLGDLLQDFRHLGRRERPQCLPSNVAHFQCAQRKCVRLCLIGGL